MIIYTGRLKDMDASTHSKIALEFDLSQQYERAIEKYTLAIKEEPVNVNVFINLAFLYWHSAAQFAWADKHNIPVEIRSRAVEMYTAILNDAKLKFPEYCELYFWEKYFNHRLVFDPLGEEDILSVLSACSEMNHVPYFFLYLFNKEKYKDHRDKLLEECESLPTAKNLYIRSIIE